ncbi:MAG: vitamin K epoxide reductase family protein [Acidobacteriota bacterium]
MTPIRRTLLIAFGALGLGAATMSSYVHYRLLADPSYTSLCDVNATVSCTQAYLSQYGTVWGVPVALGGVLFFVLVLLLAGLAARKHSAARDSASTYIMALSTIGLAAILYLGWASYFQLHTFCVLCATTYVAVIGIFVTSAGAATPPMSTLPRNASRDVRTLLTSPLALTLVVVLAAGAIGAVWLFPRENVAIKEAAAEPPLTDQQRDDLAKWWAVQPKVDLPIPRDGAKVLVVKFSDYMCPACRQTYEWYKPVLGKYLAGGQVKYVVKHYPLESECNPSVTANHDASCEAAAAVIMARAKGTAQTLEQWIFSNQPTLTPATVKKAAKEIGGIDDFDAQYPKVLPEVRADAELGGKLGITSTPTFYINGRKLPGQNISPPQYIDYLIELALKDPQ